MLTDMEMHQPRAGVADQVRNNHPPVRRQHGHVAPRRIVAVQEAYIQSWVESGLDAGGFRLADHEEVLAVEVDRVLDEGKGKGVSCRHPGDMGLG